MLNSLFPHHPPLPSLPTQRGTHHFDIETHDGARVYHLSDNVMGGDRWVAAIGRYEGGGVCCVVCVKIVLLVY